MFIGKRAAKRPVSNKKRLKFSLYGTLSISALKPNHAVIIKRKVVKNDSKINVSFQLVISKVGDVYQ
jgi:hypothetical protein